MTSDIFNDTACQLGEGPLWHPERQQFFWFDILGKTLHTHENDAHKSWSFDEYVSAAGWVDHDTLLIASQSALFTFDLSTRTRKDTVCALEADNPVTRSNDGRADPYGGFWIGTMGIELEPNAGAIYRYYKGELRKLYGDITISNSICFSPDGTRAYFTDTAVADIMSVALDAEGWPIGTPEVLIANAGHPDGSVVDMQGNIWNAQWGGSRIDVFSPEGDKLRSIAFSAAQITCPAFGGAERKTLFATSAAAGLDAGGDHGKTFAKPIDAQGQKEHQVIL